MIGFIFWQRWLFYSSLAFALFGIVFAVYSSNVLFIPYTRALSELFWNKSTMPVQAESFRAFIWAPLGGTIACCYIMLALIAYFPFKRKEKWARNTIVIAFGTWILIDSIACIYYGAYFQVYLINAFSLLQKGLPIVFTWKDFKKNTTSHLPLNKV